MPDAKTGDEAVAVNEQVWVCECRLCVCVCLFLPCVRSWRSAVIPPVNPVQSRAIELTERLERAHGILPQHTGCSHTP